MAWVHPDKTTCQAFKPLLQAPVQKAQQLKAEETDTENTLPSSSAQFPQTPRCQAHGLGHRGVLQEPRCLGLGWGRGRWLPDGVEKPIRDKTDRDCLLVKQ